MSTSHNNIVCMVISTSNNNFLISTILFILGRPLITGRVRLQTWHNLWNPECQSLETGLKSGFVFDVDTFRRVNGRIFPHIFSKPNARSSIGLKQIGFYKYKHGYKLHNRGGQSAARGPHVAFQRFSAAPVTNFGYTT